ncbi:MAG: hypothetical protein ACJ79A_17260 [Gemmatimonadaceae bacterium]
MRSVAVARGVVVALVPLDGDTDDAAPLVLGAALLGADTPLDESAGVVLGVAPDVLLGAGGARLTSPADVLVTPLFGDALFIGTQSVLLVAVVVAPVVVEDVTPLDMLGLVTPALADVDAPIFAVSVVAGVMPVPLAPFVVFGPVKR